MSLGSGIDLETNTLIKNKTRQNVMSVRGESTHFQRAQGIQEPQGVGTRVERALQRQPVM